MAIEVFNRHENKYMLDEKTFNKVEYRLTDYMKLDEYNKQHETYTITNLYYDTVDNHLIRNSLAKPKYKEKLRLRAYGIPDADAKVYVEIKKKVNGLVNKRRSALTLDDAYAFLQTGVSPSRQAYHNQQVLGEIEYILHQYDLRPALYLAYNRRAYFGLGQHDLRVSFDCNIRSRRHDLRLEDGNYGNPLLEDENWLMEIKVSNSIPVWLCRLLSEYKIYPTSFSKYGAEYKQSLENKMPQVIYSFIPKQQRTSFVATAASV